MPSLVVCAMPAPPRAGIYHLPQTPFLRQLVRRPFFNERDDFRLADKPDITQLKCVYRYYP
jgi:hypothetical protein